MMKHRLYVPAEVYTHRDRRMTAARTAVVLLYQARKATGLVDACAGNTTVAKSFAGTSAQVGMFAVSKPRGIPGAIAPGGGQSWRMGLASKEHPSSSMGSSSMVCHA